MVAVPDEQVEISLDEAQQDLSEPQVDPQDEVLAQALAEGASQVEAGNRAGVSDRTVRRRLREPAFRELVNQKRRDMITEASGRSSAQLNAAVATLTELLSSAEDSVRLRAAQLLIRTSVDLHAIEDVSARVAALEAELRGRAAS